MKNFINRLAMLYVVLTLLLITKLLHTDIGLIIYVSTSVLFMVYVLYINKKDKNS